ncbi:CRISPR system Cascade subunit CasC [Planctomycetes bacterium Pan216]|uniref:CRISPR system Cascade subunit CasC n=1 Tax=Kolteria novifilia TaxID=2527975 RepID=A0A518B0E7_9BACT|nr:CRISPR system Cascade subunit CasC [Planctomycetes bacterium Pan216]
MFIELHLIQNFAPSCLNRDDTNTPKDCRFGGYRRARISSQCLKRAIRSTFETEDLLAESERATRSLVVAKKLADMISERVDADDATIDRVISLAFETQKLKVDESGATQYLLFLGNEEITELAAVLSSNFDKLAAHKGKKPLPKEAAKEIKEAIGNVLDGGKAADLALFGRMLANLPSKNIDAASQVAHAISTNKVDMEMDFFTAVDDLKTRNDDAGAGMMGTVEFNSSCFYRYANINTEQLMSNLQQDEQLARKAIGAFLKASIEAIPTGKQNSMAAHQRPSFIFAVVRNRGLLSLANAFENPIRPFGNDSLVANSIKALDTHWANLTRVYGNQDLVTGAICSTEPDGLLEATKEYDCGSFDEVMRKVLDHVSIDKEAS